MVMWLCSVLHRDGDSQAIFKKKKKILEYLWRRTKILLFRMISKHYRADDDVVHRKWRISARDQSGVRHASTDPQTGHLSNTGPRGNFYFIVVRNTYRITFGKPQTLKVKEIKKCFRNMYPSRVAIWKWSTLNLECR